MASIIKNQLVKHLSKFARNLKPEQISLDVLKGKSELRNIELNEDVLTEVLELPTWMRIKRAHCNRVAVRVPWTKLKSSPVELFIDEIQVEIILTSDRPPPSKSKNILSSYADTGSYGFAEKIVEGMSLYVNSLEIHFDSGVFGGSFMLSRLSVESKTPGWQSANDLRKTRLNCPTTNRTILYKQVSWQLLRIEASAQTEHQKRSNINAPLRLITSGGKIRISLKKNSTDGSVIHARIQMLLEDILWVATLPQVRSAIAFYSHIMKLVQQAQKDSPPVIPPNVKTPQNLSADTQYSAVSSTFRKLDFDQTSYHLQVKKIDLHLCDDGQAPGGYPDSWNIESGAMQVTLLLLMIDVYPKTLSTSDRSHWVRYTAPNVVTNWLEHNLKMHLGKLSETLDDTTRMRLARSWPDLMCFNVVMRVYDMVVQSVSDRHTKKDALYNMFHSDRNSKKSLPSDQYIIHMEFANFFHPMTDSLPVPPPATFLQLGPFSLLFDKPTLRWGMYVIQNITTALQEAETPTMEPIPHADLRVDLLMPKIIFKFGDPSSDHRLPHRLVVSLSTVTLCNNTSEASSPLFQNIMSTLVDYVAESTLEAGKAMFRSDFIQMNQNSTAIGLNEGEQWWLRTSPMWVDTDHGEHTRSIPLVSDVSFHGSFTVRPDQINAYLEPQTTVVALVDHFQFLQLTRLIADISDFADVLATDAKFFARGKSNTEEVPTPTVVILAAINKLKLHLLLTQGPMPSPYETCPAINESSYMESLSGKLHSSYPSISSLANGTNERSSTPLISPQPRASSATNGEKEKEKPLKLDIPVEEFKEFPGDNGVDPDLMSNIDETMSITTDLSDEDVNSFVNIDAEEDLFPTADEAEEACVVDEVIENDRYYKSLMAKQVNVLSAGLEDVNVLVNVFNQNVKISGKGSQLTVHQCLNKLRSEVYSAARATGETYPKTGEKTEHATFVINAPADSKISDVMLNVSNINLDLQDEILTHLGAFVADDQQTPNKVRLRLNVENSKISIHDPKKKKPLRLCIKQCVIEQDEDDE